MADITLCPSCGASLPLGVAGCPRCGFNVRPAPAPTSAPPAPGNPYLSGPTPVRLSAYDATPEWQEGAFRVMSIVIVVLGILEVILGIIGLAASKGAGGGSAIGHGAVMTAVGAGLLMEQEWASVILRIMCWLNLVVAVGLALASFTLIGESVAVAAVIFFLAAVFGGIYGFMLYLVNRVGQ